MCCVVQERSYDPICALYYFPGPSTKVKDYREAGAALGLSAADSDRIMLASIGTQRYLALRKKLLRAVGLKGSK